jgi:hypothetical protein
VLKILSAFKFIIHYVDPRSTFLGILIFFSVLSIAIYNLISLLQVPINAEIYWSSAIALTGFMLLKFLESRSKRYNVLCHLDVELNQAMDTLGLYKGTLEDRIKNNIPILLPHSPVSISLAHVKEVGRIDVKNNLGNLLCDFKRINQDWENLVQFGKQFEKIILVPKHPEHSQCIAEGNKLLGIILDGANSSLELVKSTLVLVRIYIKTDKPLMFFKQPFISSCSMNSKINMEWEKVKGESNP